MPHWLRLVTLCVTLAVTLAVALSFVLLLLPITERPTHLRQRASPRGPVCRVCWPRPVRDRRVRRAPWQARQYRAVAPCTVVARRRMRRNHQDLGLLASG